MIHKKLEKPMGMQMQFRIQKPVMECGPSVGQPHHLIQIQYSSASQAIQLMVTEFQMSMITGMS